MMNHIYTNSHTL